ncbi:MULTISPECIES: hypothetical protein [unclassified Methylobacterium]|uniref:hypothetical protein n=1 Tax=unclassified Methylobacterium TaxID=2615210 RepID=UPI0006F57AE4|nr:MULTISPECIES: hypothetical protein [unclassified Methylobacterium]KQO65508.1 hypothetical protein ASF20_06245 [Methylobacterium sp. Leaf88]KQP50741.1 hypothetical protein ASF41_14565 [Methylobacterium sp. Leaf111]
MAIDPFTPRNLASAIAFGGLVTMMIAPEPSWHSAGIGLACLLAFGGLSLLPAPRSELHDSGSSTAKRRGGRPRTDDAREVPAWAEPAYKAPEPPASRGLTDPHPALFKGMRTRRSSVL